MNSQRCDMVTVTFSLTISASFDNHGMMNTALATRPYGCTLRVQPMTYAAQVVNARVCMDDMVAWAAAGFSKLLGFGNQSASRHSRNATGSAEAELCCCGCA